MPQAEEANVRKAQRELDASTEFQNEQALQLALNRGVLNGGDDGTRNAEEPAMGMELATNAAGELLPRQQVEVEMELLRNEARMAWGQLEVVAQVGMHTAMSVCLIIHACGCICRGLQRQRQKSRKWPNTLMKDSHLRSMPRQPNTQDC